MLPARAWLRPSLLGRIPRQHDFILMRFNNRTVTWAEQATPATQGRSDRHGNMLVGRLMKISRSWWHMRRRSTTPVNSSSPTQTSPVGGKENAEDEQTIFELDEEEDEDEGSEDDFEGPVDGAAAPSCSSTAHPQEASQSIGACWSASSPCESCTSLGRKFERARFRATRCGYCPLH